MKCPVCAKPFIKTISMNPRDMRNCVMADCECKFESGDYEITKKPNPQESATSHPIDWSDPNFPQVIQVDTAGNDINGPYKT